MSLKRQAPDEWDEHASADHAFLPKAARLDTGDSLAIVDDPFFNISEEQGFFDDAAFQDFLEIANNIAEEPPASVLRDFQSDRSHTQDFDPELKFSPVKDDEDTALVADNNALSEDIDWDQVIDFKEQSQKEISPNTSFEEPTALQPSSKPDSSPSTAWTASDTTEFAPEMSNMRLNPHKTFFRLQEMLQAKMYTFKHSHDTIFELFARVIYSSRENFNHRQYFQFRDLFTEAPPYLTGALSG